jgi:hypothetical protein
LAFRRARDVGGLAPREPPAGRLPLVGAIRNPV